MDIPFLTYAVGFWFRSGSFGDIHFSGASNWKLNTLTELIGEMVRCAGSGIRELTNQSRLRFWWGGGLEVTEPRCLRQRV